MIRLRAASPGLRAPRHYLLPLLEPLLPRRRGGVSVDILLLDDADIARYNAAFKGRKCPTDVLAWPDGSTDPETGELHLGDIALGFETAKREAVRRGLPAREELALYAVHGLLHLLGHDDGSPRGRRAMRAAERRALSAHGITPHWERDEG